MLLGDGTNATEETRRVESKHHQSNNIMQSAQKLPHEFYRVAK